MAKYSLRNFFTDKDDKIVTGQVPNPPIIVAAVAYVVRWLADGTMATVANVIFYAALTYWAYLETRSGVNNFRKALGWLVLFGLLVSLIV